jgi:hypothetical protein
MHHRATKGTEKGFEMCITQCTSWLRGLVSVTLSDFVLTCQLESQLCELILFFRRELLPKMV